MTDQEPYIKNYENGKKCLECHYKDKVLHGSYKEWHSNGKIRIVGFFKDGKLDGPFKLYTKEGNTLYYFIFDEGKRVQGYVWPVYLDNKLLEEIELDQDLIKW